MEVVAHVLQLVGAACLLGTPAAGTGTRNPPAAAPVLRRTVLILGPLLVSAGLLLDALLTSAALTQSSLWSLDALTGVGALVRSTSYGLVLLVRALSAAALAAALAFAPTPAATIPSGGVRAAAAAAPAAVAAVVLALSLGAGGHAQTSTRPLLTVPAQGLHTALAAAWFGGLAQLAVLGLGTGDRAWLARSVGRFSRFGLIAMLTVVASGVLLALTRVSSPYDLVETNYGLRLAAKLLWVGGVLGLAALNRFAIVPRLAGWPGGAAPAALRLGLIVEALVGFGVVVLAGALATTPPPLGPADRYVVYLDEYRFEPAELTLRAGRVARVVVINRGETMHDWSVPTMPYAGGAVAGGDPHDHGENMIHVHVSPGGRGAIEFIPLRPGRYPLLCTVWPHAEEGMVGWVTVVE
ncbi:MAG TPA: CopD family protein [Bacillota bacterium]